MIEIYNQIKDLIFTDPVLDNLRDMIDEDSFDSLSLKDERKENFRKFGFYEGIQRPEGGGGQIHFPSVIWYLSDYIERNDPPLIGGNYPVTQKGPFILTVRINSDTRTIAELIRFYTYLDERISNYYNNVYGPDYTNDEDLQIHRYLMRYSIVQVPE